MFYVLGSKLNTLLVIPAFSWRESRNYLKILDAGLHRHDDQ